MQLYGDLGGDCTKSEQQSHPKRPKLSLKSPLVYTCDFHGKLEHDKIVEKIATKTAASEKLKSLDLLCSKISI